MNELTAEKQARMFAGEDSWTTVDASEAGIPSIRMSDGPNGLRIEKESGIGFNASHPATLYPTASLTACSFDRELQYKLGEHLAREATANGVNVLLGPGVNHKRSPLCGRNFEYYSEDPYLSGELGAAYVKGVQDQGVGVSLKHYAANSREYGRLVQDSIIDERALREIYLAQFEAIIKQAHPWTIMTAYNRLNGIYCTEHKPLLDLARAWGFDGLFVSDWGAVSDPARALAAGLNLEMPGGDHGSDRRILKGLQEGTVTQTQLDASTEVLRKLTERVSSPDREGAEADRLPFAAKAAQESAVLLKNENVLPLDAKESIALIGPFARTPRIQGAGSSKVNATEADCLYDAMKEDRMLFSYTPGFTISPETPDAQLEVQALALAERSSKVIVVAGLPEGDETEGRDRTHLRLPENQNHLIHRLAQVSRNVIVILQCGAPVELPWIEEVEAVLCMYLSGARGGRAAMNLLSGKCSPSGKLAETWPVRLEDTSCKDCFSDQLLQVQYRESIYTGYRYYDAADLKPLFPFGFGLSYTSFQYRNLRTELDGENVTVYADITNTGSCAGREIVQLYVAKKDSRIARPKRELKGFEKILLEPGETATVTFHLSARSFSYFDTAEADWKVEAGIYQIQIGASSRDIRLETQVFRNGTLHAFTSIPQYYVTASKEGGFTQPAFEAVLGRAIPPVTVRRPFTADTSVQELQSVGMGRLIKKGIDLVRTKVEMKGISDDMILEVPIRSALMVSDRVTWDTVDAIVNLFNGKTTIFGVLKTVRKKRK